MTYDYITCRVTGNREVGFGLEVTLPSGELKNFNSLSFDLGEVESLCKRINLLGVSECHLCEILEDFLP